ncbi:MAG: TRAP transporter large permease subunit [Elusimicrobiota bacterium]|jgi:tripartite ATP-independent transporter DctM subunit
MSAVLIALAALSAAAIGAPLFTLLGGLGLALFHSAGIDGSAVIVEFFRLASLPALSAIPLFTAAGFILAESRAPQRLLGLTQALFGWLPGGLAVVALAACALFTAFTGASGVTIVALGGLLLPMLLQQGYPERFSLGLLSCTGSLGLLFPPSLPIILYGLVAQVSIHELFLAALVPGLLLLGTLALYAGIVGARAGVGRTPFSRERLARAVRAAAWDIPLPFIVVGGIYAGFFTASDAAAVMAAYVLAAELLIHRDIPLRKLPGLAARSMALVGAILVVLGTALGLTNYLVDAQVPDQLFALLHAFSPSKALFLIALNAFLLVVNMLEIYSAIVIAVPIVAPIAIQYGIDPVHLGVIFLLNLEIGYMTPPMGLNLLLANRRFERPLGTLYRAAAPFWLIHTAVLAAVTYLPSLSLSLSK